MFRKTKSLAINPKTLFLFVLFCLCANFDNGLYAAGEDGRTAWGFQFDNDWLTPTNEDRNYTFGLGLKASGKIVSDWYLDVPLHWMDDLTGFRRSYRGEDSNDSKESHSALLGLIAFTPNEIGDREPIYNDRPYASLLYLSVSHSSVHGEKECRGKKCKYKDCKDIGDTVYGSNLSLGVLGLRATEFLQTRVHGIMRTGDRLTPVDPLGWKHQISDGGELTAKYTLSVQKWLKNCSKPLSKSIKQDLAVSGDISVGYFTNCSVASFWRIGKIESPFWEQGHIDELNNIVPSLSGTLEANRGWIDECFFWFNPRVRLVAYNALLQGQFRSSDVTFNHSKIERVLFEGRWGLTFRLRKHHILSWYGGYTSQELTGSIALDHQWNGIKYAYYY